MFAMPVYGNPGGDRVKHISNHADLERHRCDTTFTI